MAGSESRVRGNYFSALGLGVGNLKFARDFIQLDPSLDGTTTVNQALRKQIPAQW